MTYAAQVTPGAVLHDEYRWIVVLHLVWCLQRSYDILMIDLIHDGDLLQPFFTKFVAYIITTLFHGYFLSCFLQCKTVWDVGTSDQLLRYSTASTAHLVFVTVYLSKATLPQFAIFNPLPCILVLTHDYGGVDTGIKIDQQRTNQILRQNLKTIISYVASALALIYVTSRLEWNTYIIGASHLTWTIAMWFISQKVNWVLTDHTVWRELCK